MAISTGLASLRRTLAQRMNFWGGDLSNNGPGTFSATGTVSTAIDTVRPEPDEEWDESWLVLNPGSADQVNAPTIWRRTAISGGWISTTGTFTIQGTWPIPYNIVGPGFDSGTSTGVNSTTMTDGGKAWTVNQWKGHTITLGASTAYILSNTATALTLTSTGWSSGTPSNGAYTITMPYEVYKVFRPENWLQAINWAIVRAYPKRHIAVSFDIPLDMNVRIIRWGDVVNNLAVPNPTTAPTVTEIANGQGTFQPGQYTFAYTLYNDLGETLIGPTSTLTVLNANSQVKFADITGIVDQVFGVNFYGSQIPNNSTMGQFQIGDGQLPTSVPVGTEIGIMLNGTVTGVIFPNPPVALSPFVPIFNTTNVDVQELHHIMKRLNPGQYPEIWNDLGSDLYKPMGGKSIMLMFMPLAGQSLKLMCTAPSPSILKETDVTDEPPEMIYAGAEHYLWNLLVKTSTIVNVNWRDLAKESKEKFEELKHDYALDLPRTIAFRPVVRTQY